MHVVATAGHVDHGKSTLVKALTGMETDRWAEERRRGLTIDLGFAWTALPSGRTVAFVDVPGHQRFLGNTLAGLGTAPAVCFVVAADEGWRQQSSDHRDAIAALGIKHGLVVITRADLAPHRVDAVIEQTRQELASTGLATAPAVAVAAITGTGLHELRSALDGVLAKMPPPEPTGRLRLWVDRSFTVVGAGTVVTGTLTSGTIETGQKLQIMGHARQLGTVIRRIESLGAETPTATAVSRVAINLRGIQVSKIRRGDALITPGAWPETTIVDVRRVTGSSFTEQPDHVTAYFGTASIPATMRPLGADHARVAFAHAIPLAVADRLLLRDQGTGRVAIGAVVLDVDPPALKRRGDAARNAAVLAGMAEHGDFRAEVARRGAVKIEQLQRFGLLSYDRGVDHVPENVTAVGQWLVHTPLYAEWRNRLHDELTDLAQQDALAGGLSRDAAANFLSLPDITLLDSIIRDEKLHQNEGLVQLPAAEANLGPAETSVCTLEHRLAAEPFAAPNAGDLRELGLGPRELAAARRAKRLLLLPGNVVLLPTAPVHAVLKLAQLDQPFTVSDASAQLCTTRRVAIPLLEYLDAHGKTRRIDTKNRMVIGQSNASSIDGNDV